MPTDHKHFINQTELFTNSSMNDYDKYIVAFSGGKDSIACFLHLLESGVPKSKIELWHHDIDGRGPAFMDWECTPAYCRAFAAAFGVPIFFSWKQGGFKTEMLRKNSYTAPTAFECPDGTLRLVGGTGGKKSTRLKFPQLSHDLSTRWCSAYLKIMVCSTAIVNQKRFNGQRTVVISGERGEESKARSQYAQLEKDHADSRFVGTYLNKTKRKINGVIREVTTRVTIGKARRHVDRWRPILHWSEQQVWALIEKYRIRVHPCYYLGYSRCSCKFCIFGNCHQFASSYAISPEIGEEIISHEDSFGVTIKRGMSLRKIVNLGTPYGSITEELARRATKSVYDQQIIFNDDETWNLPAGAYRENCCNN